MESKGDESDMLEKSTSDLKQELMSQPDLDQYIKENAACFADADLTGSLARLCEESGISKAELARRAEISEVYLHQALSGRRKPSRDRLLCLCIAAKAALETVQELLRQAGCAPIYPRQKRDAIISHGILYHTPLVEVNERLFRENEKTLF